MRLPPLVLLLIGIASSASASTFAAQEAEVDAEADRACAEFARYWTKEGAAVRLDAPLTMDESLDWALENGNVAPVP